MRYHDRDNSSKYTTNDKHFSPTPKEINNASQSNGAEANDSNVKFSINTKTKRFGALGAVSTSIICRVAFIFYLHMLSLNLHMLKTSRSRQEMS